MLEIHRCADRPGASFALRCGLVALFVLCMATLAACGQSSSDSATPPVSDPAPTITTQPQNQSVTAGATATFTVVASGSAPLTYQWSKNGTTITGATSASYTTPATVSGDNGSTFSVQVSNSAGSATSSTASLTVTTASVAPTITTQPQNQSVTAGATATFTVVASGSAPLTYQWSKNGTTITGATGASYTTPATVSGDNGSMFSVRVSNSAGSATSSTASLTVTTASVAPTITTQPQPQSVTVGATATFAVVASGSAPLTYQWSKNGTAIAGATSASYTTPATVSGDNGSSFTVQVSNSAGSSMSTMATLTVNTGSVAPTIINQPQNLIVTVGTAATFTVVASGTAPLTYQWSKNGTAITGATNASYTTSATLIGDNGSTFSVQVSNTAGSATSGAATLTVTTTSSGAPIMFQHIASSANPVGNGISGHAFTFHTESLPPNTVAVLGVTAPAATSVTISDTLAGSWSSAVCSASGGSGNYKAWVFAQSLGSNAGTDTITINVGSSNIQPVQFDITFWQNISTSSPTDGSLCTGNVMPSSGGLVSPGSFTPSTNNNANGGHLIWNYTALCGAQQSGNPTSWVPAAGYTLLNGEIIWITDAGFPQGSEYYLQATNAPVTPSITATGDTANCYNSASVALKVANNGAAAISGIHVAVIGHESFTTFNSPGTMKIQVPWFGNLRVLTFSWIGDSPGADPGYVSAITNSDGCNFTEAAGQHAAGGASIWYAQGCSPCPTCKTSMIWSGSANQPQGSFRYYDVQNASSSSYQNNISDGIVACGTLITNGPTFTPTGASSGLTIQVLGNGNGPITGFAAGSPTGAAFDLWTFAGQTDSDVADNADASNHLYYSTTATQNWNFNKSNGNDDCYPAAAAFN